jgi:thiol-disulfide isomerase/thioredoxin
MNNHSLHKKYFLIFILLTLNFVSKGVNIPEVTFTEVANVLNKNNDTTYVLNFWATWCLPCRKEIPYFEEINKKYKNKKFKLILISLDFPSKKESLLIPFVKENIKSEVWLLNEPNPNSWIDKVNNSWTGAIPATIIFNKNTKLFFEKTFEFEELNLIIKQNIIN